jgi:hypothetical protein
MGMNDSFCEYRLDDATITKLTVENADLRLFVRNWRDELDVLVFDDVIGVESLSFINSCLSHGNESTDDEFLNRCCSIGNEAPSEFRCFQFYSAWSDTPILRIVARSFGVSHSEPSTKPIRPE